MDRLTYLEEHHQITESMIGLMSIQEDIAGVQKVLAVWKPKLQKVIVERAKTVCLEQGRPWEDIKHIFSFGEEE